MNSLNKIITITFIVIVVFYTIYAIKRKKFDIKKNNSIYQSLKIKVIYLIKIFYII